ncbi:MAG: oligosaccharide flippase family protein [Bacteroidaceae bacterium]|nr:oligosaccharide flippase family protein [Bacteroidaceae bacterium]
MTVKDSTHRDFESSYRRIFRSTGLMGAVQVLTMLAAVVRGKAAATFIKSAGLAVNDLYSRNIALIGSVTNLGLGFSAVQRLAELHDKGEDEATADFACTVRTWVMLTAVVGLLAGLVFSPVLSLFMTGGYKETWHFCLLAPVVAFTTLMGGEIAVLKGLHELRRLAVATALTAVATLLFAVPLYMWLGFRAIIPVLFLSTFASMAIHLVVTNKPMPYRLCRINRVFLKAGIPLLRLGVAYVLAGVVATAAELIIRTALKQQMHSWDELGLYAAGFTLIVSYARIVFVAMDADFYPRLSAAARDKERTRTLISRQTNVLVMLMTPLLILFALSLPVLIPLLLTTEFLPVIPMVVCGLAYMFFKAVYTPAAYLSLANADSTVFLVMETAYNLVLIACVLAGYAIGELTGAGIGLSAANLFDMLAIALFYRHRYGLRYDSATLHFCAFQFLLLMAGLAACLIIPQIAPRAALCLVAVALSGCGSLLLIRRQKIQKIQSTAK